MEFQDKLRAKYATLDASGRLISILAATTIIGWLLNFFYAPAYQLFELPNGFLPALLQPWSWITYGFLHGGLFHFIGNAFGIFIAGNYILNVFKGRQFITLFFMGVIAGSISFVLSTGLIPGFFQGTAMIGASAGVFALIFFACTYFPETEYRLIFVNIKLKYFAYFFLAINVFSVAFLDNKGGNLAHLAGAAVGYYAAVRMKEGLDVLEGFSKIGDYIANLFKSKPSTKTQRNSRMKTVYKGTTTQSKNASSPRKTDQAKVDAILDKISSSGYESLSKAEKDYLFNAGKD